MEGKTPADRVGKLKKLTAYESLVSSARRILDMISDESVNVLDFRENLKILLGTLVREVRNSEGYFVRLLSYLETPDILAAHSVNTAIFAHILTESLEISSAQRQKILTAAFLHDIGKMDYPARVKETFVFHREDPSDVQRHHAAWGSRIVSGHLKADPEVAAWVSGHHEKASGESGQSLPENIVFTANLIDNILVKTKRSGFDSLAKAVESLLASRKDVFLAPVRNILNELFDLKKEGRRHRRYRISAQGTVHPSTSDVIIPCGLLDISSGGVKISVEEPLNEFFIYLINAKITPQLHVREKVCRIAWHRREGKRFVYGLKFETSSDEIIASLVEQF